MSEIKTRKKRIGRPPKHGGYSLLTAKGDLPENRKYVRRYLTAAREGLIRDLGPTEEDLTAAQAIIIDRIVTKLGIIRCIEEYVRSHTVMEGDELAPSLKQSYLTYNESIRRDLVALGIKTKATERGPSLAEIIADIDSKKRRKE